MTAVVVAHDYLTQRGGAERVALVLSDAFPAAPVLTSLYHPAGTYPEFGVRDVRTSRLNAVPTFRRDPRVALPLLPWAFDTMAPVDAEVALCSTTGFAHGLPTSATKIVYCHNPPRWLYQPEDYLRRQPPGAGLALRTLRRRLLSWDQRAATSAARYLVNSTVVRRRVQSAYGIDAEVLPPPVGIDPAGVLEPVPGLEPGYFLAVGRPRGYKNTEVVIEAFREHLPAERLVVVGGAVGSGTERVRGLTGISDAQLRWVYAHCEATVSVAHEDFGLTPLEGNAFGRPALCLRGGGFLDTLDPGVNGWFVEAVTPSAVADAVRQLRSDPPQEQAVRHHASRYSKAAFVSAIRAVVADAAR